LLYARFARNSMIALQQNRSVRTICAPLNPYAAFAVILGVPMRTYTAVIERNRDTGLFVGYIPGWPGAHSQGASLDELRANLLDVIDLLREDGEPQLQAAEAKAPYGEARHALRPLVKEREPHNGSAARSLEAGLDETLTLPRVEMFTKLGISVKTTNLIERVMARVEAQTHRITRWRTSDQKQRWCAATLHDIEKQFRKVQGHQPLALLHAALGGKLSSPLAAA
jgi:predicted RNase H-like HicB family nuclease